MREKRIHEREDKSEVPGDAYLPGLEGKQGHFQWNIDYLVGLGIWKKNYAIGQIGKSYS